jgi:adenylate cyclase
MEAIVKAHLKAKAALMMIVDLCDFTSLSDALAPLEIIEALND